MGTCIAILRGINVSGARPLPMKELKALMEELGCANVTTYIQSGNVVCTHARSKPEVLAEQVEQRIRERYGYEVPVLMRSAQEWKAVIAANPFLAEPGIALDKLHVTFLAQEADAAAWKKVDAGTYGVDRYRPGTRAVYLHCPAGYGNTRLNNGFFESKLGTTATTRNWRTVNELLRLAQAL